MTTSFKGFLQIEIGARHFEERSDAAISLEVLYKEKQKNPFFIYDEI